MDTTEEKQAEEKKALDRWQRSLKKVSEILPLWRRHADRAKTFLRSDMPTAATDGKNLFLNPTFANALSDEELNFVVIHELLHIILRHPQRAPKELRQETDIKEFQQKARFWNFAVDIAVHHTLMPLAEKDPRIKVPANIQPVEDPTLSHLSAEEIYEHIKENPPPGSIVPTVHVIVVDEDDPILDTLKNAPPGSGEGGSLIIVVRKAKGDKEKGEGEKGEQPSLGEDLPKDLPEGEGEGDTDPSEPKIRKYGVPKNPQGFVLSEGTLRGIDEAIARKSTGVDWTRHLSQFITRYATLNYSWRRPNYARFLTSGVLSPKLHSPDVTLVIYIDNSGSISTNRLTRFGHEVNSLRELLPGDHTIHMIHVDSRINRHDIIRAGEPIPWNARAGGCNDFKVPFDYVREQNIQPDGAIYFTDADPAGGPPIPREIQSFPVLWCLWPTYGGRFMPTPWGERLEVNDRED